MFTYIFSAVVSILSAALLSRLFSLILDDFLKGLSAAMIDQPAVYGSPLGNQDKHCFAGHYGKMLFISLVLSFFYYVSYASSPERWTLYAAGILGSASLLIFMLALACGLFLTAWVAVKCRAFANRHRGRLSFVDRFYSKINSGRKRRDSCS